MSDEAVPVLVLIPGATPYETTMNATLNQVATLVGTRDLQPIRITPDGCTGLYGRYSPGTRFVRNELASLMLGRVGQARNVGGPMVIIGPMGEDKRPLPVTAACRGLVEEFCMDSIPSVRPVEPTE